MLVCPAYRCVCGGPRNVDMHVSFLFLCISNPKFVSFSGKPLGNVHLVKAQEGQQVILHQQNISGATKLNTLSHVSNFHICLKFHYWLELDVQKKKTHIN